MVQTLIFITFVFLVIISVTSAEGQWPRKCAEYDEYCQYHSDCCSYSCMSYLYRCTRNYSQKDSYSFFGGSIPGEATLEEIINLTLGNKGGAGGLELRKQQEAKQTSLGFDLRFGEIKENIETSKTEGIENANNNANPLSNGIYKYEIVTESPQVAKRTDSAVETTPTSANKITTYETKNTEAVGACKPVGEKCYTNDECCTKRCHGFLHQCVT